jgi:hypothetical protein
VLENTKSMNTGQEKDNKRIFSPISIQKSQARLTDQTLQSIAIALEIPEHQKQVSMFAFL